MKQIAVVLAAILSLALVAPALAQPFADVPTEHWAYDAIAELAAKGLIEGYPDGAFRGDRAMTRYEMAMVVARLLARIEAIKIPPLPGDLVRTGQLTQAQAANAAARQAIDQRLTAKLATIQRLVAEFRAELAALGVRVTAVEEELAAIRARLDNTRVTGDYRTRYNVYPINTVSGGGTSRQPDVRVRMRLQFSGRAGANVEGVVRLWAANNAGCTSDAPGVPGTYVQCGSFDTPYGSNYNYGLVSFDLAYVDVRNTWGASLWRIGRQFFTLDPYGPFGLGIVYDPSNSLAVGTTFVSGSLGAGGTPGLSDGLRSDWSLGPLNVTAAIFRDAILNPPGGVQPGLGARGPAVDHRILSVSTGSLLPGWTLAGHYYQAWIHPTCTTLATLAGCSGGTSWGGSVSGNLMPGISIYGEFATWSSVPTVGAAQLGSATAWRVGGNVNLAQVLNIPTWNPNFDWAYQSYGPLPVGGVPPVHSYATTITGQTFNWNMRGWMGKLNLTFSPRTSGYVLYETGTVLCITPGAVAAAIGSCATGTATYSEWWLRLVHNIAPRTFVTLNYFKGNTAAAVPGVPVVAGATPGDYFNFYRAELLYSW